MTEELIRLAERAARAAADLIAARPARVEVAATKSSPTDVVTAMDTAAEEVLRDLLSRERPDDAVLGEEAGLRPGRGSTGLTWVLDPIDGTANYLYGLPAYAVSVAVVTGDPTVPGAWRAEAGCVRNPVTGETWTAGRGVGAWLDGTRLTAADARALADRVPRLDGALVSTGFGYRSELRRQQAAVVGEVLPLVRDLRRMGSAALDLCSVAVGRLDAHYERGLNVWDVAAAALVATELGVRLTGGPFGDAGPGLPGDLTLAARPTLHADLRDALVKAHAVTDGPGGQAPGTTR